ncbi:ABC transporter permease [Utexia brackfieldae]|uniref:ABC transporter permease n=1 Tax=Utexia brackfieldae TaxID=3074108 RepID=UPI00370D7282
MAKAIWSMILTELKNIFTSRAIIGVLLLGPLIYFVLYPQPYLREVLTEIPVAVVDQDNSTLSRQLIRNINATEAVKVGAFASSMQDAKQLLAQHKVYGIVLIPFRFEQQVIAGKSSPISLYGDASYILIYNNVATAINSVALTTSSQISVKRQIAQGIDPAIAKGNSLPFIPNMIALFNPQSGYATYAIPPVFILILHQLLLIGILLGSFLFRDQTLKQVTTLTPTLPIALRPMILIISKLCTYLMIYTVIFWLYMLMINLCYHIPNLADLVDQFVFGFIFLIPTITFALALSVWITRVDDVLLLLVPVSMIVFFLSGISWPIELIPSPLVAFGHLIPAIPAMIASTEMTQMGTPFYLLAPKLINLGLLALLYFLMGYYSYYRKLKQVSSSLNH